MVFNDAVAARRRAHAEGLPYPSSAELSRKLITEAKRTEERAWLGEVSSVPLQQALRDADAAYANFFASIKGKRKGRRMGLPRFKKRSYRQAARFTRNAGFKLLDDGRLRLPKLGTRGPGRHSREFAFVLVIWCSWVQFAIMRS